MIEGLVAGRLLGEPEKRVGKSNTVFAVAKVKATASDGDAFIVNVIAFEAELCVSLWQLRDGDALALSGSLTPKVWTDKQGVHRAVLDMVAHKLLSFEPGRSID